MTVFEEYRTREQNQPMTRDSNLGGERKVAVSPNQDINYEHFQKAQLTTTTSLPHHISTMNAITPTLRPLSCWKHMLRHTRRQKAGTRSLSTYHRSNPPSTQTL